MGALDGIRVIDLGQYVAGPLLGMLLADQGADVIKVDPPSGPRWPVDGNATWNRGKRSIALDLARPDELATARRLVASADVLVENFRPGVLGRLGLDPEALAREHPRLVVCSLPGFAADDPRAAMPAWEGVVGAATATYSARGSVGFEQDERWRPIYTAIPTASCYAAFQGAVAIAMALVARDRDGVGQRIEVPLFDAMFGALGFRGQHPFSLRGLAGLRTSQYECADGRWVQFHSGNKNVPEFMEAAGIASWRDEGLLDARRRASDPSLAAELDRRMVALFKTRTAREWEDLIARAGSEATVCRTTAEWVEHPHARESQMVVEVTDHELGRTLQPGVNVRMSRTPGAIRAGRPRLDADRAAILRELDAAPAGAVPPTGWPASRASAEATVRAALDGVTVLDLCVVLAGPTCGRTLAEYGAHVIKIDSPRRSEAIVFHNDVNRGKHSILLDLKSEGGQAIFWRLVEGAAVVVQNFRKGVAESLGVGYEQVRARKPGVVYASLNSYGHVGPWANRPGHEQLAQAATGMQVRFGGDGPPVLQTNAVNDYGTGFMGAYGVAIALLHQRRTGEGQHVDTSLAYTGCTLQSPFLVVHERTAWDEPRGQDALGDGPLHRAYRAQDGWLFVGARAGEAGRVAEAVGLRENGGESLAALGSALERRFAEGRVDDWVVRVAAAGLAATRVVETPRSLMTDPWVVEHGLSVTREHEGIGELTTTGPVARLSRTPVRPGRAAPRPGSDAQAILDGIGMGGRLAELVAAGVVRTEGVQGL